MRLIGIDPGFSGGICFMRTDMTGTIVRAIPMPVIKGKKTEYDVSEILRLLKGGLEKMDLCIIEQVSAMPKQGVTSMFRFGYGAGLLEGIVRALGISLLFVRPQEWQNTILKGLPKGEAKSSRIYATRKYPNVNWKASDRCKVIHDGMTDALCLAEWGLTKM